MNSVIIFSTQRSCSRLLADNLNRMIDDSKIFSEIAFESFFIRNNLTDLLLCDDNFNENTDFKIYDNMNNHHKQCYYNLNSDTIQNITNFSNDNVIKIQYDQILNNEIFLENVKTPIIFLIRRNQFKVALSKYIHYRDVLPSSHIESEDHIDNIALKIDWKNVENIAVQTHNLTIKFYNYLFNKKNVKIVYSEDITSYDFWNDNNITQLENFIGKKFTQKNVSFKFRKSSNFIDILNLDEIDFQSKVQKYYINL